jgi:hypothetical protein
MPVISRHRQEFRHMSYAALAALSVFAASAALGQGDDSLAERKVQAVFLLNFARFVDWPAAPAGSPMVALCIGVLGDDPFGPLLDAAVRGETIQGRSVIIRRSRAVETLLDCHIVFISQSESAKEVVHLAALASRPILTVGELPGFTQHGGAVFFYRENDRVRFEISRGAIERAGLKFNPQLMRLARVVAAFLRGEAI